MLKEARQEYRNINGILGKECEATQFEGMFTSGVKIYKDDKLIEEKHYDKMCDCSTYKVNIEKNYE